MHVALYKMSEMSSQSIMRLLHLVGQGHHPIINHKLALNSMSSQASMNLLRRVVRELHKLRRVHMALIH